MINIKNFKKVHIIGIGGSASSAIAELLHNNGVTVTGSELSRNIPHLEKIGIKINFPHDKKNLNLNNTHPDIVLFSPAIKALDPDNPELSEAKRLNIPLFSWQEFIGEYLNGLGKIGITTSGSEGKGTTCGILTAILKDTEFDPLSILGAKIKNINNNTDSNIYSGSAKTYILEADEYNFNFYNYHPSINIMINFKYEHPETYKDFNAYKESFYNFFKGMKDEKLLILRAQDTVIDFINEYSLRKTHRIILFGDETDAKKNKVDYLIKNSEISPGGIKFLLLYNNKEYLFNLKSLPGYLVYNSTGAIIAGIELGLNIEVIKKKLLDYNGMVRRFDLYRTKNNGVIITDYGHSPESLNHIIYEIRNIFAGKKIHIIFQPHLFSRTYNFFNEFIEALKKADSISLLDIFGARENIKDWENKISSLMIYNALKKDEKNVFYAGKSSDIIKSLTGKINEDEVTCFIGAGDMDLYYPEILKSLECENYF